MRERHACRVTGRVLAGPPRLPYVFDDMGSRNVLPRSAFLGTDTQESDDCCHT